MTFGGDLELAVRIVGKKFFTMALSLFSVLWGLSMIIFIDIQSGFLYTLFTIVYAFSIYLFNLPNKILSAKLRIINGKLASFLA